MSGGIHIDANVALSRAKKDALRALDAGERMLGRAPHPHKYTDPLSALVQVHIDDIQARALSRSLGAAPFYRREPFPHFIRGSAPSHDSVRSEPLVTGPAGSLNPGATRARAHGARCGQGSDEQPQSPGSIPGASTNYGDGTCSRWGEDGLTDAHRERVDLAAVALVTLVVMLACYGLGYWIFGMLG